MTQPPDALERLREVALAFDEGDDLDAYDAAVDAATALTRAIADPRMVEEMAVVIAAYMDSGPDTYTDHGQALAILEYLASSALEGEDG